MANTYKYIKTISDSVRIKGEVSQDGKSIRYMKDDMECVMDVQDIFDKFTGELVTLSITSKDEQDLSDE